MNTPDAEWLPAYAHVAGDLPLDEVVSPNQQVICLSAEVEVTEAGPLQLSLDDDARGVTAWVNRVPLEPIGSPTPSLPRGRHKIVFRVDVPARAKQTLRVVVNKPTDAATVYTVVGGP